MIDVDKIRILVKTLAAVVGTDWGIFIHLVQNVHVRVVLYRTVILVLKSIRYGYTVVSSQSSTCLAHIDISFFAVHLRFKHLLYCTRADGKFSAIWWQE